MPGGPMGYFEPTPWWSFHRWGLGEVWRRGNCINSRYEYMTDDDLQGLLLQFPEADLVDPEYLHLV